MNIHVVTASELRLILLLGLWTIFFSTLDFADLMDQSRVTLQHVSNSTFSSNQISSMQVYNKSLDVGTKTPHFANTVVCNRLEFCLGQKCDFDCKISKLFQNNDSGIVDIVNSKECTFHFPAACETCRCISKISAFKVEENKKSCLPCTFHSVGWLKAEERARCAPETCPLFFPRSCGLSMRLAKALAIHVGNSFPAGIWISLLGDSILRGIYLHTVSYLTVRQKLINPNITGINHYYSRYICCTSRHAVGLGREFFDCTEREFAPAADPMILTAAADFASRRAAAPDAGTPFCISFKFVAHTSALPSTFAQHTAARVRHGVLPNAIAINSGLHSLLPGFDVDSLVRNIQSAQADCKALLGPPAACILLTCAYTAFTRAEAAARNHSRHHTSIRALNAATAAVWAEGGTPLVDAGALSLHPLIANGIDRDRIHFRADGSPMHQLCWQVTRTAGFSLPHMKLLTSSSTHLAAVIHIVGQRF
jgi:hypothetical protein